MNLPFVRNLIILSKRQLHLDFWCKRPKKTDRKTSLKSVFSMINIKRLILVSTQTSVATSHSVLHTYLHKHSSVHTDKTTRIAQYRRIHPHRVTHDFPEPAYIVTHTHTQHAQARRHAFAHTQTARADTHTHAQHVPTHIQAHMHTAGADTQTRRHTRKHLLCTHIKKEKKMPEYVIGVTQNL